MQSTMEVLVFADCYEQCGQHIKPDNAIMVSGRTTTREDESVKLVADRIFPISEAGAELAKEICINVNFGNNGDELLSQLYGFLREKPGNCPIRLFVTTKKGKAEIELNRIRVSGDRKWISQAKEFLGNDNVFYSNPDKMNNQFRMR